MTFDEKIAKILKSNTLGLSSPSELETFIKAGKGAITTPMRNEKAPGPKTQKKIVDKLRINPDWWETGQGDIFKHDKSNDVPMPQNNEKVKVLPMDAWELLQDDNREFKKEINNLWDMISFLKSQSITPHK